MRPSLFLMAFAVALAAATGSSSVSTLPTTGDATVGERPQVENDAVVEVLADDPPASGAADAGQLSPDEILRIKQAKAEEAAEVWRNREQEAEENRNQRERARLGLDPPPVPVHESQYVVEKFVTAQVAAETEEQVYLAQDAGLTEITEAGRPVVVEITADLAQALFEEGLHVEIIERFIQVVISPGEDETGDWGDGEDQGGGGRGCTAYVFGSNGTDVAIPDDPDECNGGSTGYAYTTVSISGAPGETVCNVSYRDRIEHTYPGDLVIQLNNNYHSVGSGDTVWNRLGGSDDGGYDDDAEDDEDIYLDWRETSFFNGDPVDGDWYLDAWDHCPTDVGTIDYAEYRIYYETAAPDYVVTAPYTSPSRNTCGAGNDCDLRPSEEHLYQVSIPSSGNWTFSLCDSAYDTYLYVGTSVCGAEVGADDDGCGTLQSELTANISAGTYYVAVEGYSSSDCGNYILEIWKVVTPDYVVTAPYTSPTRNTCGAGNDCNLTSAEDHNYEVTIPSSGLWHFSLCDSDFDTWLAVGTSLCSADIGSNDDACGGTVQSELAVDISAGTYYVYVAGYTSGHCGNYVLDISRVVTPDYVVTAPYTSPTRNTCGAIDDCDITDSDNEDHIYQVSIPQAGNWTFSLCDSAYDTKLAVGTTICGEEVGYNDDFCGLQSEITANIAAGTYYVVVDGYSSYCGNYILDIFRPADYVVTAPYTSPTRNTCGAGNDCSITLSEDHNYQVTIPSTGLWHFSLCNSNYDTYLAVGTSLCSSDVGSNDDACGGTAQSELTVDIAAGTYYVYVGGYSTACGNYVLEISEQAAWTVMIYLDGDNNLEAAAITDFLEMAQVNNPDVNIVVQFDRITGHSTDYGDWTTCKRFLVTNGMTPTAANQLADIGEVNMAAAATLEDFIDWARADYPAENYALVLWDHGNGWREPLDESPLYKGICGDDTSGDQLEMSELNQALDNATNGGADPIHVIDMDACLMAGLEVAYEVKDYCDYFAASAELVPNDGNEYQDILAAANLSSGTTPAVWAAYLVTAYQTRYDGNNSRQTYMAARLWEVDGLATDVTNLATLLRNNLSTERTHIESAWTVSRHYTDSAGSPSLFQSFIDLHDFCHNLRQLSSNTAIDNQCQVVMNTVANALLVSHWADSGYGGTTANQRCFWIYFPASTSEAGWGDYDGTFLSFLSPSSQHWDEFLDEYFSYTPPNDDCGNAIPIYDGDRAFDTAEATTDGPTHSSCQYDGQTYHDIWYEYVATCNGDLTVSTCNQAEYDTDLVVYDGCNCSNLVLLGCNDDMSGCAGFTSEVTVPVVNGNCYLIRVGGYDSGDMGPGTLTITCEPDTAVIYDAWWTNEVDQDGDGCVRSGTLNWDPDVLDCDGSLLVYEEIYWKPASSGTWTLVHTTNTHTITDCATSDTRSINASFQSSCAPFDWKIEIYRSGQSSPDDSYGPSDDADLNDHMEESAANDESCDPGCPPGRPTHEGEPVCYDGYEDHFNGGCNSVPPAFSPITCDELMCGTSGTFYFNGSPYRDTDWYEIEMSAAANVTWTVCADFEVLIFVIDGGTGDCMDYTILGDETGAARVLTSLSFDVDPGLYWFWVGPTAFGEGVPCGAEYVATLTCEGGPECPGDLDHDGDVDLADLAQLLAHYGMTSGATYEDGDLDGDGDVDLADLAGLLAHYGEVCW